MQNVCSAPDYHADEGEDEDEAGDDEDINYDDGDDEGGLGQGDDELNQASGF